MSDFDNIEVTTPLNDIRKERVAVPNRKPATRRPRRGSESDIIDLVEQTVADEIDYAAEEAEEDTPVIISPRRVIPVKNPMQALFLKDLQVSLKNRKLVKSESYTEEPETEPKETKAGPQLIEREEAATVPIRMPKMVRELKKNMRERPKTMDLGDLNLIRNFNTKKSPAPAIPKIIEAEHTAEQETKSQGFGKLVSPIEDLQYAKGPNVPVQQILPTSTLKPPEKSQETEKKLISKSSMKLKTNVEGSKKGKEISAIVVQAIIQKPLDDNQLRSKVETVKSSSKTIQTQSIVKEEVIAKSYNKASDVKMTNVEKLEEKLSYKSDSSAKILTESIKIGIIKNSRVSEKNAEQNSSIKQTISATSLETKILELGEDKAKHTNNTSTSVKSTEVVKSQNTIISDNAQRITIPEKVIGSSQLSISSSKLIHATSNDKNIKNTADKVSGIKSINSDVTSSRQRILDTNIVSDKSKSIDKIVNSASGNLIKPNEIVDKKSVREVTNDLMEMNYQIFKDNKDKKKEDAMVSKPNDQAKDILSGGKLDANNAQMPKMNVTKSELIRPVNKEQDVAKLKNVESPNNDKDIPTLEQTKQRILNLKINVDEDLLPRRGTNELVLNKFLACISDSKETIKPVPAREIEKEKTITNKIEASIRQNKTTDTRMSVNVTSRKATSQDTKYTVSSQKCIPQLTPTVTESVKEDISKESNLIKSDSPRSRFKNLASWMKNSSIENAPKETTNSKMVEAKISVKQSDEVDHKHNDASEVQNVFKKFAAIDSAKISNDKQRSLGTNKMGMSISTTRDKDVDGNQTKIVFENFNANLTNSDKLDGKMQTRYGSSDNVFGKSVSKENLSSLLESTTLVSKNKIQGKSNKVENTSKNVSDIEEQPAAQNLAESKTEILINNFRLRNNINSNISKETTTDSSKISEVKNLSVINITDSHKSTTQNIANNHASNIENSSDTVIIPKTSPHTKQGLEPFEANRRNNVFRKLSPVQNATNDVTTTEGKTSNKDKSTTDSKLNIPEEDISVRIRSAWRRLSNVTSPNEEMEGQSNAASKENISQSSKVKNDELESPKVSTLANPTRNSNYNTPRSFEAKSDASVGVANTYGKESENSTKLSSYGTNGINASKVSVPGNQAGTSISNIHHSVAVKKDLSSTSTGTNQKTTSSVGDLTKSSPQVVIRSSPTKAVDIPTNKNVTRSSELKKEAVISDLDKSSNIDDPTTVSAFRKSLTYSDLLRKSSYKTIREKEEPNSQILIKSEEKLSSTTEKIDANAGRGIAKINTSEREFIVEKKWKRPVTLSIQKEGHTTSADKPIITSISSATNLLRGNKIFKSTFENNISSSVQNNILKSTPTESLTSIPKTEPVTIRNINTTPTKCTESPSTPTSQDKVSPASRHESPIFNKMFLPKSTFRSPSTIVNKSTEDISIATRGTNSFRTNRPQSLTGSEHMTVQRTTSATPKLESTIKEKNETGSADSFQAWKIRKKINS